MNIRTGLCIAALAVGAPATAQIAPNSTAPIDWSAVGGDGDPETCILTLKGAVRFRQETSELRANDVRGFRRKRPGAKGGCSQDLERIEAEGDVFYVTPEYRVRADRAVYTAADDTVLLYGRVTAVQGENVTESASLAIKVSTGAFTLGSEPSGRVRGVFTPTPRDRPTAP